MTRKNKFAAADELVATGLAISQVKTAKFNQLKDFWVSLGKKVTPGTSTETLRQYVFIYLVHEALQGASVEVTPSHVERYHDAIANAPHVVEKALGFIPVSTVDVAAVPVADTPDSEKCVSLAGKTHPSASSETDITPVAEVAPSTPSKPKPTRSKAPKPNKVGKGAIATEPTPEKCEIVASKTPVEKPPVDIVLHEPLSVDQIKPLQPGSKRVTWMQMLLEGTTIDAIATFGGWNKATAQGCPQIARTYGYGIRRYSDNGVTKYQLILPTGMTEILVKAPTVMAPKEPKQPKPASTKTKAPKRVSKAAQFAQELASYDPWADDAVETSETLQETAQERELVTV
jgi:hypothetical protein